MQCLPATACLLLPSGGRSSDPADVRQKVLDVYNSREASTDLGLNYQQALQLLHQAGNTHIQMAQVC